MKRVSALFLALLMTLALCACGGSLNSSALGKYHCTSIIMNDVHLEGSGEWLELKEDGKASLYMSGETRSTEYTLEDSTLTMTIDGQQVGTGTLKKGVLTLEILGTTCVFEQESDQE